MRSLAALLALLVPSLLLSGCPSETPSPADSADPSSPASPTTPAPADGDPAAVNPGPTPPGAPTARAAVRLFVDGILEGKKESVLASLDRSTPGGQQTAKIVAAMVDIMIVGKEFNRKVENRHGPELVRDLARTNALLNLDQYRSMAEKLARSKLEVDGERAKLVFEEETGEPPIQLSKKEHGWVIENLNPRPPSPEDVARMEQFRSTVIDFFSKAEVLLENSPDRQIFLNRLGALLRQVTGG